MSESATGTDPSAKTLLRRAAGAARLDNALSTLLGLVQVAATILLALWVARTLDNAIYQPQPLLPDLTGWLQLAGILLLRTLAVYAQTLTGNRASLAIRNALREQALQQCFSLNIRLFPTFKLAEISNLLTREIDNQRGYFADYIPQQRLAVLMPLAILLAALTVNWMVALILLLTAPMVVVFMMLVGWKAADASRANLQALNRLGDLLADRLKNLQALQLAGTTEPEADALYEQSEQYRKSTMQVLRLAFLSGTVLEFFSAISVALVAVYLGLHFLGMYEAGSWAPLGLFDGVFLLMLAPEFYAPLRKMGALYHERSNAVSMAEQLLRLQALAQSSASPLEEAASIPALQQLQAVELVSGSAASPVHEPVSFILRPGQKLLLNGPSGSGKTTLLDTLAGLREPAAGEVRINGTAQSVWQQPGWYRQVGYLSQKPELLFASIRDNLTLGGQFSEAELWEALQQARADAVVQALPGQLDYVISDSGGYLSGGQAQRIALARVFLHRPALLLLDEPTANLDADTASEFLQRLQVWCEGGGMLVMASHRLAEHGFFDAEITLSGGAV
ncbi:thiol reductant ABC exporter subunit CydD [Venatoribacter cucullus]|uniref:thiol reductant ABC exporter subunit CydD n=1 Tax=Venatoribacter cucullus TaxID=2661630 RepID=UPI00223EB36B|nr:thiol reductant ABC exporter subunit CydD [Venatoribacter cucullus]UZK04725.1 thiol reductant ABC exporter subunit CydD [Venatoribacter cucullus]